MTHYPVPDFDKIAYGNNAEDIVLLRAFADRHHGFFVDVGAGEPDLGSLTKNLVERLGWRGVNIEPLPERLRRLVDARPHDVNLQMAVGTEPGTAVFHRILPTAKLELAAGLSTLQPEIVAMHRANGFSVEDFDVEVVPLKSIFAAYAEPGFDLLKIDVEGSEGSVLASADLGTWRPRTVVVEATLPNTAIPSHAGWEPALLECGYMLTLFDGLNRFYVRDDEPELAAALSVPANVTDRFIPAYVVSLGIKV